MESFTPPPPPPRSPSSVGLLFFLWWILANSIGIVLGCMLYITFSSQPILAPLCGLFLLSSIVGVMQWLVLREYLNKMRGWIVATVVGFFIGSVLLSPSLLFSKYIIFVRTPNFDSYVLFFGFISGFPLGISQWLVLRKKVYRSQWWILATTITVGLILRLIRYSLSNRYDFWLALGVCTLAYLPMTTPTMFLLLKRPKKEVLEIPTESFTPPPPPPRSPSSIELLFFWWWILANSIGIVLGFILLIISNSINHSNINLFFGLFLLSLTVGVMQWLVLREYLHKMRGWVVATVVGFLSGFVLFFQKLFFAMTIWFEDTPDLNSYVLFLGFIWGFSLGISQWLVLRKKVYRSHWWILVTTITGGLICFLIYYSFSNRYHVGFTLLVCTLAYLQMTTPIMFFLLRHPKRELISDQYEN